MDYDVLVAGAGFAGLATATALKGRVLLIDRKSVGALPISACGTVRSMVEELGLEESILSDISGLALHVGDRVYDFDLDPVWCTFDYSSFCRSLFNRFTGDFVKAHIRGINGHTVATSEGDFSAQCIVDTTGWRSVLARSIEPDYLAKGDLGFAIEAVTDYQTDRFHFFHDDSIIKHGIAWIFPVGKESRIGVGSYLGKTDIKPLLERFLSKLGAKPSSFHGGFIPWRLRDPVCGNAFVVGDAAGMVFAVLGEGIRQSVFFGQGCGSIIQKVIDGQSDLDTALEKYREFVLKNRRWFQFFSVAQDRVITDASERKLATLASVLSVKPLARTMQGRFGQAYEFGR